MTKINKTILSKEDLNESVDFLKSVKEEDLKKLKIEELDKIDTLLEQCKDLCLTIKASK